MNRCRICGNEQDNRTHVAREMMFGYRDEFTYLECSRCGCVHITEVPRDLSKYYPPDYYSFRPHGRLKTFLRHQWSAYAFRGRNPVGWLVTKLFVPHDAMVSVRRAQIAPDSRILDVGCGAGHLIQDLWHLGFKHGTGADPFIQHDLSYGPNGPNVLKRQLAEVQGELDVIMLHHSFEHMDQPADIMRHLARLLRPGGRVILRIPIADSFAWRHYGVNWMHLDAPRHFYLHSPKSIEILAQAAGLVIDSLVYEGNESQFCGSEQYLRDIPLLDRRSWVRNRWGSIFTRRQRRDFRARAEELNRRREGDLACFYLR